MGGERPVILVLVSESFREAVTQLVVELGGTPAELRPEGGAPWPVAEAFLVLAGGEEPAALELLAESRTAAPRLLIGASADHRIAAAAVQSGARDYFALPADFDLLRRSLERLLRDSRSRDQVAEFAEAERHRHVHVHVIPRQPDQAPERGPRPYAR